MVKLLASFAAFVLLASVGIAYHTHQTELSEMSFSLENVPVFVARSSTDTQSDANPEYKLDTTVLCLLIKRSVDPAGWNKPGIKIETATLGGKSVLRIIQTRENQETIAGLLSEIRKSSPYFVEPEEQILGVAPKAPKE